eukprot:TRINITY_DN4114_c0_g1_i1.p1 TRINITY_DN4114_c0_g1~~TRINITY_DN4114_c0_g1_i1.p1  ORF type:complete len:150 (-),score=47.22 TRINITY_DN4114_c0_g1_i1:88-537(-)
MISAGVSIDSPAQDRMTALHFAASNGKTNVVEYLLTHGADVNGQAQKGKTALHFASSKGHHDTAKLLSEFANGQSEAKVAAENQEKTTQPQETNQDLIGPMPRSSQSDAKKRRVSHDEILVQVEKEKDRLQDSTQIELPPAKQQKEDDE